MLIVSIQGYSQNTTSELSQIVINSGAYGIRTDVPVNAEFVIGLEKDKDRKYYITTSREMITRVSKWTNNIAIDCRKGNMDIDYLLSICHLLEANVVADIETIEDVKNIIGICESKKIVSPKWIATTFSRCNIGLIKDIKNLTDIDVIAEGGYDTINKVSKAYENGAKHVCIGAAISGIDSLTRKFSILSKKAE